MAKIGVIGAGGWGLALAILLNNNGHEVKVWSVLESEIDMLNETREHKKCLPGVIISDDIVFTKSLDETIPDADILVMAVASPYTRSTANIIKPYVKDNQIIVNVSKGIEEDTLMTLSQIVKEVIPNSNVCVLSGPSHAEEVSRGVPTSVVVGANDKATAEFVQTTFMSKVFRVYISNDVLGICLGGALKNVIALAAGMADGLGYGDNTKAALITRGIAEIGRLGMKMGGKLETFSGLSGIGDLIVTCASMHSRNRRAGILIGQGKTYEEAMDEVKMVVEGVYSAKASYALAKKYDVSMPIVEQVNEILFNNKPASEAVMGLMLRDKTTEYNDCWS